MPLEKILKEHQGGDITFTLSNDKANDGKSTNTNSSVNVFTESVASFH